MRLRTELKLRPYAFTRSARPEGSKDEALVQHTNL